MTTGFRCPTTHRRPKRSNGKPPDQTLALWSYTRFDNNSLDALKGEFQSKDDEMGVIVDLALEQQEQSLRDLHTRIVESIRSKVREHCNGFELFGNQDYFQHSTTSEEDFVDQAKKVLSSSRNTVSPVVDYARIEGNLIADWLPRDTELVLIDGEGIGHDTREASRLSARHLDYFHFADVIGLVEECEKPFASGGKSAIEGIIRNGYLEKFALIFSKLDKVEVGDDDEPGRGEQVKAVKKGVRNVSNALKEQGLEIDIADDRYYYLANMKDKEPDNDTITEIRRMLAKIRDNFAREQPVFIEPVYDYEMLSSCLTGPAAKFSEKWNATLNSRHWQTIKAFNRRMCWEEDEFRDMKPVSDFHAEVTLELDRLLSNPRQWRESATPSLRKSSIERVKQEFSKQLLALARSIILKKYGDEWESAMELGGTGSTVIRKKRITAIVNEVLPDHRTQEAVELKDSIKGLLQSAINECKV